jgi:tetratricopeptide (TPR) repeat protein
MVQQHSQGSRYVVPYTNDPGTDHFVGTLPADKGAERALDQIKVPRETKAVSSIRPACILATRDALTTLLRNPLADPYALLSGAPNDFSVAGGALASHSTRCVRRFTNDTQVDQPLLVAALIVKDEEKMLPDCLESLASIVDRIEICDTGSTDKTIEIARAAGANVIERDWPDDFGKARNYVLEQCRDARYVLWIDADERVVCPDPVHTRRYLATYHEEHQALSVDIVNVESDGSELYNFSTVRLFHGTGTEFRGAVHEAVHAVGDTAPLTGHTLNQLKLLHHGYAADVITERSKKDRNLELAEAQYAADGDARSAINLARSLGYSDESPQRALELLETTWAEAADAEPAIKAQILGLMADRCVALGNDERAFELTSQALELVPADDTTAAVLAKSAERLGRYEELIEIAERIAEAYSPRPVIRVDNNRTIFRSVLAAAYAHTGRAEKAVTEAFAVLSESPEEFHSWEPLITSLRESYADAAVELLAPLTAMDPGGAFLEPMIKTFSPSALADFGVLYRTAGGTMPEVTRVGLLSAAMAGRDDAFAALAPAASSLDPLVRVGLADRIASKGREDLAAELRVEPVILRL